jgi:predicted aspartyl protease
MVLGIGFAVPNAGAVAEETEPAAPFAEPPGADLVETEYDRYQRMTIPVTIDGQGPFRFMIDTGSQATVVTRELSEQLALESAGTGTLVGMASTRVVPLVELHGLEFANRIFDNLTSPLLEAQNIGADGIIGIDSLQDLRVLINFRQDTISVADADAQDGSNGYEIVVRARRKLGQLIITDAEVDGIRTALIIDTGAQYSYGNLALRERLRMRRGETIVSTDVNGVKHIGDAMFARKLEIGRLSLKDLPIAFADSPAFHALGYGDRPALSLGMLHLRAFDRIAIDFSARKVFFDLPRAKPRLRRDMRL